MMLAERAASSLKHGIDDSWTLVVPGPIDDLIINFEPHLTRGYTVSLRHSSEGSPMVCTYLNSDELEYVSTALRRITNALHER